MGTGIVEALAKHLHACVAVSDTAPGAAITISRAGAGTTPTAIAAA